MCEKVWLAIFGCNIWQATLSVYLQVPKWHHAVLRDFLIKMVTSLFSLLKWLADAGSLASEKKKKKKANHFKQNFPPDSIKKKKEKKKKKHDFNLLSLV